MSSGRSAPGGRRVDMEIAAAYRGLARRALVWIEVKAGAIYQPQQPDYAEQVRDSVYGEPDGRLLTIIPPDFPEQVGRAP